MSMHVDEALGSLDRFAGLAEDVDRQYDERAAAIRAAFNAGASITAIARRLKLSNRRVVYDAIHVKGKGRG